MSADPEPPATTKPEEKTTTEPPPQSNTDPEKVKKKKKKKKKKKAKRSTGGTVIPSRTSRAHPTSYGAAGGTWSRRESIPHHATVQSLASINQPSIVNKLSKMSQDLKYHRELTKALMELKQKDEDYRYAIEIGESLTKENQYLKEQIDLLESQLHTQETDNDILKEKLETLSQTYNQDLYKYHQDLQAHKEIVSELTNSLQHKDQQLYHQKEMVEKQMKRQRKQIQGLQGDMDMMQQQHINYARMTSDDINNLSANDFESELEKKLYLELEKEKKKHLQDQQTIENLMKKLDDMLDLKKKYDSLKKANEELKQITRDELAQHIQMQKSIEQEAIYLASRNANLEEKIESDRTELMNLLEQRDYEITMLKSTITLLRKQQTRTSHSQSDFGNAEATLGDDIADNEEGSIEEQEEAFYHTYEGSGSTESDQDEMDFLKDILEDEALFDPVVHDDDDDEDDEDDVIHEQMKQQQQQSTNIESKVPSPKKEEITEESRDKKAFDKIKEYLHLTASAVKIKYPTVKNIQSDELIKRVRELPFYKYHDQMVRIMEAQIRKQTKKLTTEPLPPLDDGPPPTLQKRKSFLSIFNIFGAGSADPVSDDEGSVDDNKSDAYLSDNEDGGDSGISSRRKRRQSGSGRPRRRSMKKKKRKSSVSSDQGDIANGNENGGDASPPTRYRRGLSVQASQQRLKGGL